MSGKVYWNDIQMKEIYNGQKAQFHGSRLNDLLGVSFHEKDTEQKIQYILFNPMAVRTPGAEKMKNGNLVMKFYYKFFGKDIPTIVEIIHQIVQKKSNTKLIAYKLEKTVDLKMRTFQSNDAKKLDNYTSNLLKHII